MEKLNADDALSEISGDLEIEAELIKDIRRAIDGKPVGPVFNALGRVMQSIQHYMQRPRSPVPAPGGGEPKIIDPSS